MIFVYRLSTSWFFVLPSFTSSVKLTLYSEGDFLAHHLVEELGYLGQLGLLLELVQHVDHAGVAGEVAADVEVEVGGGGVWALHNLGLWVNRWIMRTGYFIEGAGEFYREWGV